MQKVKKKLGELLIESGLITEEILEKVLILQKEKNLKLGEAIVSEGFLTEDEIINAIQAQLSIDYINVDNINIRTEIINIVPESVARKHEVIPLDIVNGKLILIMSDPLNYYSIEEIRIITGYAIKPAISSKREIMKSIEKYYGKNRAEEAADDYGKIYNPKTIVQSSEEYGDENAAPIIKFINTIIENALINNASDIHIEPFENELRVRYRVDGVLREIMKVNVGMIDPVISRIKIMAELNIAEKRNPQDGRVNFRAKGRVIDIRISVVPTIFGEKVVMRLLDKSSFSLDIDKMGFNRTEKDLISSIISRPNGIVLVCGPTGSGKTTTLYTILNVLNDASKNIITIEDPVEYNMNGVNQMQVNNKIGFTFASGLKNILRQDPDIILIGEIRDKETAEISVRSALTGHLVLSSIHTNSAIGTVTRLMDMGIEPFLISSTLSGIIAQRLIRKICSNCGETYISDESEMKILNIDSPIDLKKGRGCSYCNNTGYKGRVGVFEIIDIDREVKDLINAGSSESVMEACARKKGVKFLRDACIEKVTQGVTSIEELLRVTYI